MQDAIGKCLAPCEIPSIHGHKIVKHNQLPPPFAEKRTIPVPSVVALLF